MKVPEGMLKAAAERVMGIDLRFKMGSEEALVAALEAALKWLAENPIRPTDQQAAQLWKVAMELDPDRNEDTNAAVNLVLAWQRMMFSEPPVLVNAPVTEEDFRAAYEEAMTMSAPQGNFRGGWDACLRVLARRATWVSQLSSAPMETPKVSAPVDAGLVERMLIAFYKIAFYERFTVQAALSEINREGMERALRVAADALLGPVTNLEQLKMRSDFSSVSGTVGTSGWDNFDYALDRMIAARRARLLSAKTPEERVTIHDQSGVLPWVVYRDGVSTACQFESRTNAEIYRIGLIATLKGEM